jgi:hypothetical protein
MVIFVVSAYRNMMSIATYSMALARAEAHAEQAIRNDPVELGKRRAKARRLRKRREWDE